MFNMLIFVLLFNKDVIFFILLRWMVWWRVERFLLLRVFIFFVFKRDVLVEKCSKLFWVGLNGLIFVLIGGVGVWWCDLLLFLGLDISFRFLLLNYGLILDVERVFFCVKWRIIILIRRWVNELNLFYWNIYFYFEYVVWILI